MASDRALASWISRRGRREDRVLLVLADDLEREAAALEGRDLLAPIVNER